MAGRQSIFSKIDVNGDGFINQAELQRALESGLCMSNIPEGGLHGAVVVPPMQPNVASHSGYWQRDASPKPIRGVPSNMMSPPLVGVPHFGSSPMIALTQPPMSPSTAQDWGAGPVRLMTPRNGFGRVVSRSMSPQRFLSGPPTAPMGNCYADTPRRTTPSQDLPETNYFDHDAKALVCEVEQKLRATMKQHKEDAEAEAQSYHAMTANLAAIEASKQSKMAAEGKALEEQAQKTTSILRELWAKLQAQEQASAALERQKAVAEAKVNEYQEVHIKTTAQVVQLEEQVRERDLSVATSTQQMQAAVLKAKACEEQLSKTTEFILELQELLREQFHIAAMAKKENREAEPKDMDYKNAKVSEGFTELEVLLRAQEEAALTTEQQNFLADAKVRSFEEQEAKAMTRITELEEKLTKVTQARTLAEFETRLFPKRGGSANVAVKASAKKGANVAVKAPAKPPAAATAAAKPPIEAKPGVSKAAAKANVGKARFRVSELEGKLEAQEQTAKTLVQEKAVLEGKAAMRITQVEEQLRIQEQVAATFKQHWMDAEATVMKYQEQHTKDMVYIAQLEDGVKVDGPGVKVHINQLKVLREEIAKAAVRIMELEDKLREAALWRLEKLQQSQYEAERVTQVEEELRAASAWRLERLEVEQRREQEMAVQTFRNVAREREQAARTKDLEEKMREAVDEVGRVGTRLVAAKTAM